MPLSSATVGRRPYGGAHYIRGFSWPASSSDGRAGSLSGDGRPAAVAGPCVLRLRPDDPPSFALLEGWGNPASRTAERECRGEHRRVEADALEQERRVELDICPQPPAGLVLVE